MDVFNNSVLWHHTGRNLLGCDSEVDKPSAGLRHCTNSGEQTSGSLNANTSTLSSMLAKSSTLKLVKNLRRQNTNWWLKHIKCCLWADLMFYESEQLHLKQPCQHGGELAVEVLGDNSRWGREQRKSESHQSRRQNNTHIFMRRKSRPTRRTRASCQVTAFRFWQARLWLASVGVKNWTLGVASCAELFLRRLPPAPLRMELLRRMELRFLSEFWCDSSLFWRVWIKIDGFSSSSLALQSGVVTLKAQEIKNRKWMNHKYGKK